MATAASAAISCARSTKRSAPAKSRSWRVNDLGNANTNAHLTRYDTAHGKFHGEVAVDGDCHGHQRRPHQGARRTRSGEAALGRAGGGHGVRMHRHLHQQGQGRRAPGGRREEGADFRAGWRGRRRHRGLWREPRHADFGDDGGVECLVHHQLPGAAGQGAARQHRHRQRTDDHDSLVHQRPGADRRLSRGPASRPFGHHVDDPHQDRRRRGRGPGIAATQGQARRLRHPRADHQCVAWST